MAIIIGGSSSSGSSLLQTMLNRHSRIYCGPETSLFAKRQLYVDWDKNKKYILKTGLMALRNPSWFMLNGVYLIDNTQAWTRKGIDIIINDADTFSQFAERYFSKLLKHHGKIYWIEKTPTNAINFDLFLKSFTDAKVVHMIRNPYDTIASLVNRGYSPYYSCGLYLCNTASALSSSDHKNYIQLRYEDLVANPADEMKRLCRDLDIVYEDQMRDTKQKGLEMKNSIHGWNYDADEPVGKKSIGRFSRLDKVLQEEIKILASSLILRGTHKRRENSIEEICNVLGYEFQKTSSKVRAKHILERNLDMFKRTMRTYPTHILNYPVTFTRR